MTNFNLPRDERLDENADFDALVTEAVQDTMIGGRIERAAATAAIAQAVATNRVARALDQIAVMWTEEAQENIKAIREQAI